MKPTSKEFLEKISSSSYAKSTTYKFKTEKLNLSEKYIDGRLAAYDYINNLCFYYLQEEKSIPERFREQVNKQMKQNSCLNDSDYKDGLYDALNDVLDEL